MMSLQSSSSSSSSSGSNITFLRIGLNITPISVNEDYLLNAQSLRAMINSFQSSVSNIIEQHNESIKRNALKFELFLVSNDGVQKTITLLRRVDDLDDDAMTLAIFNFFQLFFFVTKYQCR